MYVCMDGRVYVRIDVCVYACVCMYACMYICKQTFMYVIVYIRTHVRTCLRTYARMFVYTYVHACMRTCGRTYVRAHTHPPFQQSMGKGNICPRIRIINYVGFANNITNGLEALLLRAKTLIILTRLAISINLARNISCTYSQHPYLNWHI